MRAPPTRRELLAGIVGSLSASFSGVSLAASDDAFYRGKTLTVIVGFAPGGGVDTTARVVAQHLVRFIPGQPRLIVQNMEGAAGVMAANHIGRRVMPDGLTLAVPGRAWFIESIIKSPGVVFDSTKLSYIGSPGEVNSVAFVRSRTGIKSFDELKASKKALTFGALAGNTATAMVPVMLAEHGVPIKVVVGYGSSARILVALEQGEVDGFFTVEDTFGRRQDLISNRIELRRVAYDFRITQRKILDAGLPGRVAARLAVDAVSPPQYLFS